MKVYHASDDIHFQMKHETPEERQASVLPVLTRATTAAVSMFYTRIYNT